MASLFIGLGVIFDIDFVLDSVMENGVKKYKHFSPHKHKMYIGINPDKVSKSIYKQFLDCTIEM